MRNCNRALPLLLVFVFCVTARCLAAEDAAQEKTEAAGKEEFIKTAMQKRTLTLSISDCVLLALKSNAEIRIAGVNPRIKAEDIKMAWAEFEPTLNADFMLHDMTEQAASALLGAGVAASREIDFNVNIEGKLVTGTRYSLDFLNNRDSSNSSFQTINPSYTSEPKLTLEQPLLRGFGIAVNKAEISIAANNKQVSEENLKNTAIDIIASTKNTYYNYIYYREAYRIAADFVEMAVDLLRINRARYKKGLVSSVDLLETEAAVLTRRRAMIQAENLLKKAEDDLKYITNLVDDPKTWSAAIELSDELQFGGKSAGLVDNLVDAFNYRPDYASKKVDLQNKDIRIKVTKNALFPTVDLIGSFGLNGLGTDYPDSLANVSSDYKDWSVGIALSLPWGGGERADYNKSLLEKAQGLMELKRLEQAIILDVRDKVRGVDLAIEQVEASQLAKESQWKNYQAQKERYAAGQVSTHDMLDYQDKFARADLEYIKSIVDYNVAWNDLDKSIGLTLERNNVKLEGA
ncbi:MAG: TolC family protein [Candidatus Omnitrophica bacterium]|nr:TolC family protein [Candidatus Omnitrophota bacterium]MDD5573831.1 TolC family protein [Candidatus Omnitrophota bacterium]